MLDHHIVGREPADPVADPRAEERRLLGLEEGFGTAPENGSPSAPRRRHSYGRPWCFPAARSSAGARRRSGRGNTAKGRFHLATLRNQFHRG